MSANEIAPIPMANGKDHQYLLPAGLKDGLPRFRTLPRDGPPLTD